MQSSESHHTGALNHPESAEWMDYLYGELDPERKRELNFHLSGCAECASQVQMWNSGMNHLDEWVLPPSRPLQRQWIPAVKWAAAAALMVGLGFGLGRRTASPSAELMTLKATVAQLAAVLEHEQISNLSNTVTLATIAANAESMRLLDDYSRLQAGQRDTDRQAFALTFQNLNGRLGKLRSQIETVALNTESGFQQTHQNLTRLASFSMPASDPVK